MKQADLDRNEIIEMLRASCESIGEPYDGQFWTLSTSEIETFAKLVDAKATAKEREACAKLCDESAAYQKKYLNTHAQGVANGCSISIRARGETTLRGEAT